MTSCRCLLESVFWRSVSTDKCGRESRWQTKQFFMSTKLNTRTSIRSWFFHFDCSVKCVPSISIIGSAQATTTTSTLEKKLLPCKRLQAFQFDKVNICWAASQNTSEAHNNVHIGFTLLELLLMVHTSCRFVGTEEKKKKARRRSPNSNPFISSKESARLSTTTTLNPQTYSRSIDGFGIEEWTGERGKVISFSKPIITSPSCLYKYEN